MKRRTIPYWMVLATLWLGTPADAQNFEEGTTLSEKPHGSNLLFGPLDPVRRRWRVPLELFPESLGRHWTYAGYARDHFERYVNTALAGHAFYDTYGDFVTRGWLIYSDPFSGHYFFPYFIRDYGSSGSRFGPSARRVVRPGTWINNPVLAADSRGHYHYALAAGTQLRSTLTPLTFSKPRWDGVQFDLATNRFQGTLIHSRVSGRPSVLGGRGTVQVGDFATLGLTMVNAPGSNPLTGDFAGALTGAQNQTISFIEILLRDDSPEDGVGGAVFAPAHSDIIITYIDGRVDQGKDIRFEPIIRGGLVEQPGLISADGHEEIHLVYDFDSPAFVDRASGAKEDIAKVEFRLLLSNDYQVWVTSNRALYYSVLGLVAQAEGNVQDNTNLQTVGFEYGLPTGTHLFGASVEVRDFKGFDLYGEYDLSWSYRKYPNVLLGTHEAFSGIHSQRSAPAWMVNVSKRVHPFFFFGEAYSIDPRYSTRTFTAQDDGFIDYEDARSHVVELVEDNDDQDRFPDTVRKDWRAGDRAVFPSWDHDNDSISDFNQNDDNQNDDHFLSSSIPDYNEPFLRYNVDPPEFLFGIDLNNNLWIDRFENDPEPDYPYKKDHRGFNVYGGMHLTPEVRLMAGVLREDLISSNQENRVHYVLFTLDESTPDWGHFRLFEMLKSVEDDIPDDLLHWLPDANIRRGQATRIEDPLIVQDTYVNSLWLGHDYARGGLRTANYLKYDWFHQRMAEQERLSLGLRERDFFFGLINKISYRFDFGRLWLEPRWKSEYRHQSIGLVSRDRRQELTQLGGLLANLPLLSHTVLQAGLEYTIFEDLRSNANDFTHIVRSIQITNSSAYLGYNVIIQMGRQIEDHASKNRTAVNSGYFLFIYVGLE